MDKLRKYGLQHHDLPTMVSNATTLCRLLSLNLDPNYVKKIPKLCYMYTITVILCYFYVCVLSMIWFVFWECKKTGDVVSAMVLFSLGILSEISTVKFIYLFIYQKTLRNTVRDYLVYDKKADVESRFSKNLLKLLRGVKKRALTFWFVTVGNTLLYWIRPFVTPGRHLVEDVDYIYGLSPILESPNYELAQLVSMGASSFTVTATVNIGVIFIIMAGYIEAQMLCLSEELLYIWKDAQIYFDNNYDINIESKNIEKNIVLNRYIKTQLKVIVEKHKTNKYFLNRIENVYRSSIAIEFGLVMISLIADFLGGIKNTYMFIPYGLMQLSMDCYIGQKLLDSSYVFQGAVYESKWENFDVSNMKTVLIMLLNSQKEMKLSVGGMRTVNYLCMMDVCRGIYSVYTALSSTLN